MKEGLTARVYETGGKGLQNRKDFQLQLQLNGMQADEA
jgi:hypothetical protein